MAVKDLVVNPNVFVKNELSISGQVRVDGYVNVDIPVRVLFETAPGKMEVVAEQTVRATADGQLLPVKLSYVPLVPGEHKLTLQAAEQPGELATTNNELSTFVNVLKGGLNVLYVEGALRVEEKFLRRALDSSPDIKVDYVRIGPPRSAEPAGRLRRPLQAGQVRRVHPRRRRLDGLRRRRTGPAGRVRQPRGGADHARRLPDLWPRRIREHPAGQGAAGGHGPARAAAAGRAGADRPALARPAQDAAHAAGTDALRPFSGGQPAGERGPVVEAAAAGRGQQVPRPGPRRGGAGRGRCRTSRCWSPTTSATAG